MNPSPCPSACTGEQEEQLSHNGVRIPDWNFPRFSAHQGFAASSVDRLFILS